MNQRKLGLESRGGLRNTFHRSPTLWHSFLRRNYGVIFRICGTVVAEIFRMVFYVEAFRISYHMHYAGSIGEIHGVNLDLK